LKKEHIMADRKASAIWEGTLKAGKGNMHFAGYDGPFTFASRFEEGKGTNPEELLGAAHAGCYSMALSAGLTEAGFPPEKIERKLRKRPNWAARFQGRSGVWSSRSRRNWSIKVVWA
jgi:organic hydroperoxide reductase OsmC/OhrA